MTFLPTKLLRQFVLDELRQRREEGCDVPAALETAVSQAGEDRERLQALYEELQCLTPRADFPFVEPSDLKSIRDDRPAATSARVRPPTAINEAVADRIHGGWLGRCAGLVLGKPLETLPFVERPECVRRYLQAAGAYPLDDYVPQDEAACRT
jgi:hypothetical protein